VLALDLSKRVRDRLKRRGIDSYLTRNRDTFLSIPERARFARQLRADLYLSIHLNSFPALPKVEGIETLCLGHEIFSGKKSNRRFFFFNDRFARRDRATIDMLLKNKVDASRMFADEIQSGIISYLRSKKIDVVDRGLNSGCCLHTFVHSSALACVMVELGFLTNDKERGRLSTPSYREDLAESICRGIEGVLKRFDRFRCS